MRRPAVAKQGEHGRTDVGWSDAAVRGWRSDHLPPHSGCHSLPQPATARMRGLDLRHEKLQSDRIGVMISLDALTVVAAVAGAVTMALVGWLLGARRARRGQPPVWGSETWRSAATKVVVLGAVAAAIGAPIIVAFWVLLALNFVLGQRENVPFSTFRFFDRPATSAWALRFEDAAGDLVPIRQMGISPHNQKKRFDTEVRAARAAGSPTSTRRDEGAAEVLAVEIEEHRRPERKVGQHTHHDHAHRVQPRIGGLVTVRTGLFETRPG